MNFDRIIQTITTGFLSLGILSCQTISTVDTDLSVHPDLVSYQLSNGLNVYILETSGYVKEPNVSLRLIINAGSKDESNSDAGLSHLVEHMMFTGEAPIKGESIETYLQSIDMDIGPDINAFTGYDKTVFELTIPHEHIGEMGNILVLLKTWLSDTSIDDSKLEVEKQIILEEWRYRTAGKEDSDHFLRESILSSTALENKAPIGTPESIESFTAEQVETYIHNFYRPENSTLIITGDVKPSQIIKQLNSLYGTKAVKKKSKSISESINKDPWTSSKQRFSSWIDDEIENTSVYFSIPHIIQDHYSTTDIKEDYLRQVVSNLLFELVTRLSDEKVTVVDADVFEWVVGSNIHSQTVRIDLIENDWINAIHAYNSAKNSIISGDFSNKSLINALQKATDSISEPRLWARAKHIPTLSELLFFEITNFGTSFNPEYFLDSFRNVRSDINKQAIVDYARSYFSTNNTFVSVAVPDRFEKPSESELKTSWSDSKDNIYLTVSDNRPIDFATGYSEIIPEKIFKSEQQPSLSSYQSFNVGDDTNFIIQDINDSYFLAISLLIRNANQYLTDELITTSSLLSTIAYDSGWKDLDRYEFQRWLSNSDISIDISTIGSDVILTITGPKHHKKFLFEYLTRFMTGDLFLQEKIDYRAESYLAQMRSKQNNPRIQYNLDVLSQLGYSAKPELFYDPLILNGELASNLRRLVKHYQNHNNGITWLISGDLELKTEGHYIENSISTINGDNQSEKDGFKRNYSESLLRQDHYKNQSVLEIFLGINPTEKNASFRDYEVVQHIMEKHFTRKLRNELGLTYGVNVEIFDSPRFGPTMQISLYSNVEKSELAKEIILNSVSYDKELSNIIADYLSKSIDRNELLFRQNANSHFYKHQSTLATLALSDYENQIEALDFVYNLDEDSVRSLIMSLSTAEHFIAELRPSSSLD